MMVTKHFLPSDTAAFSAPLSLSFSLAPLPPLPKRSSLFGRSGTHRAPPPPGLRRARRACAPGPVAGSGGTHWTSLAARRATAPARAGRAAVGAAPPHPPWPVRPRARPCPPPSVGSDGVRLRWSCTTPFEGLHRRSSLRSHRPSHDLDLRAAVGDAPQQWPPHLGLGERCGGRGSAV